MDSTSDSNAAPSALRCYRALHNTFSFGETGDGRCATCGFRTVLVSFTGDANVNQEPFESGEFPEDSPEAKEGIDIPEDVYINDEITGHFCIKCDELTSLSFNGRRSSR